MIRKTLGKLVFETLNGWTYDINPDALSEPKQILIGFPHTSNWDAVRGLALFNILDLNYHVMVKRELFRFPLGQLLTGLGCIPVDRAKSSNVVQQMVDIFAASERFTLVMAPEATRGKDGEKRPIRTGFWHIAKAVNVPIVFMLSDSTNKKGLIFGKIMPGDSIENDLKEIQARYAEYGVHVELPEKYQ